MAYMQTPGASNYYPAFNPAYVDQLTQLRMQQYQQPVPTAPNQPQNVNSGILWVQGEAGAKSYLVAPNTTVLLMDSEGQRFYLKTVDNAGIPSLRTFTYSEVLSTGNSPTPTISVPAGDYVTRDEYEKRYAEIIEKLNSLTASRNSTKKKEAAANE